MANKVLVIATHADDEVIGVGGTLARLADEGAEITLCIVTNGFPPIFDNSKAKENNWPHNNYLETQKSNKLLGVKEVKYFNFPAAMLESVKRYELNGKITELIKNVRPSLLFMPHVGDMQKDHQIVAEATMVGIRPKYEFAPKKVLAYETLSETGWNIPNVQNEFIPNVFVDISESIDIKLKAMRCYQSQISDFPNARSWRAIEALARYRGATMNVNAAEAFMLVREVI